MTNDLRPNQEEMSMTTDLSKPTAIEVLKAYGQWEADMIMSQEAWRGGMAYLPTLTEPLWDRLLEIQAMRNQVLRNAQGATT